MNLRAVYPIYDEPVRLEKVTDGLWVTSFVKFNPETDEEYFRSADLFKKPMTKPQSADSQEHPE